MIGGSAVRSSKSITFNLMFNRSRGPESKEILNKIYYNEIAIKIVYTATG